MRWLPREHGSIVIWLASVVLALLALPEVPSVPAMAVFALGCLLALLFLTGLTGRSVVLVRLERNPALTPALASPLTLIVPFGHLVMVGPLTPGAAGLWVVYLAYTVSGVAYTGEAVRAALRGVEPAWRPLLLSALGVGAVAYAVSVLGALSFISVGVVAPLLLHRLLVGPRSRLGTLPRPQRIRRVGFAQTANLFAAAVILALAVRW